MASGQISLKQIGLDKTNTRIVTVTAVSAFLVVFFLMASYMLFKQLMYQNKVIAIKKQAVVQLRTNIQARDSLVTSYKAFASSPQNIIGGSSTGNGPNDGSNAKIVLDALPSHYDFPALTSSLEKLLLSQGVQIDSITGTDDEVTQSTATSGTKPASVEIPFEFNVNGNYNSIRGVIDVLDKSIRPFQILTTEITGDQNDLKLKVTGKTFYQPENALKIDLETVTDKTKVEK
jgi:hypothetical protein